MSEGSVQTELRATPPVRLEPGSHRTPGDGVCVVELASVLAGEPFSDRPRCVCDVIGAFLRGWNDRAGYADRQRLRPYASRIVGTGGYRRISLIRRDLCLRWAGADLDAGPLRRVAALTRMRLRIAWSVGLIPALRLKQGAGAYAARVCFHRGGPEAAFELLDRLLEVGAPPDAAAAKPPTHRAPAGLERVAAPAPNGNGNGNGHSAELGIRATIVARMRGARTRAAPGSGSTPGGNGDRRRDRRAGRRTAGS